jgi:BASS family bile acid:Na+ symporter
MAMAAGAEVGPVLAGISRANVRLAGGLLVLSIGITIVYLPLMIGVFLPDADVPVGHLALKLSLTILAPLAVGLLVKARFDRFAHRLEHWMHPVSRIFVILVTVDVLLLYYRPIIALLGSYALLAALISVVGGFAIGYLLGGSTPADRLAMAYMHGARSASIAVMVASDVFRPQPKVMLMVAVVTLFILVLLIPASRLLRIKPGAAESLPHAPAA